MLGAVDTRGRGPLLRQKGFDRSSSFLQESPANFWQNRMSAQLATPAVPISSNGQGQDLIKPTNGAGKSNLGTWHQKERLRSPVYLVPWCPLRPSSHRDYPIPANANIWIPIERAEVGGPLGRLQLLTPETSNSTRAFFLCPASSAFVVIWFETYTCIPPPPPPFPAHVGSS